MKEDKQKICDALVPVLRMTQDLYDIVELEYHEDRELVYAHLANGYQKVVCVEGDSGAEMIRDIMEQIT